MSKFLAVVVSFFVLMGYSPLRAEVSQATLEHVTDFVCGKEWSISWPEKYLKHTRCNYRFMHDGAEVWVFYMKTESSGSPEELADQEFCRKNPGIWCQEPRPPSVIRHLTIAVRWQIVDDYDPGNFIEDYIIDEGVSGRPSFGTLQSREVAPQAFRFNLDRQEGVEYRSYWSNRYRELIDATRAQVPHTGDQS